MLAYLDTCIVSGIAKGDLALEQDAVLALLRLSKAGRLDLVTSEVTRTEIEGVPRPARDRHEAVYLLLSDVPLVATTEPRSQLVVARGGGRRGGVGMLIGPRYRENPLYTKLKGIVPDDADAHHLFQAVSAGATHFVTSDKRTILRHAAELERDIGITAVLPSQLTGHING
jgi:hypothetical protein